MLHGKHTIHIALLRRAACALALASTACQLSACLALDEGTVIREDEGRTVTRVTTRRDDKPEAPPPGPPAQALIEQALARKAAQQAAASTASAQAASPPR